MRPNLLLEPQGPQERVLQHTVEHAGAICPFAQILDAPVPQTVEQLPNIVQSSAALSAVPEQVIEVPKILPHDVPRRHFCRAPQLVEQLVEVPTIISFSSLQWTEEQNVDIPVVGGSGAGGGLSGFLPRQNSTGLFPWNRTVDIPTGGGLQGFQRGQSSTAFLEQITVSPNPGGSQNFQPVQGSAFFLDTLVKGFFALFPR